MTQHLTGLLNLICQGIYWLLLLFLGNWLRTKFGSNVNTVLDSILSGAFKLAAPWKRCIEVFLKAGFIFFLILFFVWLNNILFFNPQFKRLQMAQEASQPEQQPLATVTANLTLSNIQGLTIGTTYTQPILLQLLNSQNQVLVYLGASQFQVAKKITGEVILNASLIMREDIVPAVAKTVRDLNAVTRIVVFALPDKKFLESEKLGGQIIFTFNNQLKKHIIIPSSRNQGFTFTHDLRGEKLIEV